MTLLFWTSDCRLANVGHLIESLDRLIYVNIQSFIKEENYFYHFLRILDRIDMK